jgi:hypothetical protein
MPLLTLFGAMNSLIFGFLTIKSYRKAETSEVSNILTSFIQEKTFLESFN